MIVKRLEYFKDNDLGADWDTIYNVTPRDLNYHVCFPAIHVTAAQRAEAFLRTLGK